MTPAFKIPTPLTAGAAIRLQISSRRTANGDTLRAMYAGSCYCGAVTLEVKGEPMQMGYCHCANCRKYSGAPVALFTFWKPGQVKITRGEELMGTFASSEMTNRLYCIECGTHLIGDHPGLGIVDIRTPLKGLTFKPTVHLNYEERVLPIKDGLPKLKDFPPKMGGSGETLPE